MPNARSLRHAKLSVVAPCYNEEAGIAEFVRRAKAVCVSLGCQYEIVLVNDGSRDRTLANALAVAAADPTVRVVNLLRNFGHQAAATAGLDAATGDVVGRAHGDDRGEFLLLLDVTASTIGELVTPLDFEVVVYGPLPGPPIPATADLPSLDPLWDLPLEPVPPAAPDEVTPGIALPAGYGFTDTSHPTLSFDLGRLKSIPTIVFS